MAIQNFQKLARTGLLRYARNDGSNMTASTFQEKPHILVVDDDDRLRALLKKFLSEQGFMVSAASDAEQARRMIASFIFDLMVLDVMMPGESGLEFLSSLAPKGKLPVLMLSAMGEAEDRVSGLEIGAEDYLVKPFEPKELVLRIKTILRRSDALREKAASVAFGQYQVDLGNGQLKRGSEIVSLTSAEAAILKLLAENAGTPVSREALSSLTPGGGSERSVDVQITRLRKKIEDSDKPIYLQTVRGAGYVLYTDGYA
jgi:two-component system, OmpR family, phosphate regulon response regulator OmpR